MGGARANCGNQPHCIGYAHTSAADAKLYIGTTPRRQGKISKFIPPVWRRRNRKNEKSSAQRHIKGLRGRAVKYSYRIRRRHPKRAAKYTACNPLIPKIYVISTRRRHIGSYAVICGRFV